jgi:hypothetical protein
MAKSGSIRDRRAIRRSRLFWNATNESLRSAAGTKKCRHSFIELCRYSNRNEVRIWSAAADKYSQEGKL